jgi:uncharacterized protein DUF222
MMTELAYDHDAGDDDGATPPPQYGLYLVPPTDRPPEYADVPIHELIERIDAERSQRAANDETLAAGFCPRPPSPAGEPGSGFETGGVLDTCAPDGVLAGLTDAVTREGRLAELNDDELIGVLRAWRRLESWSSAGVLAAIAELARRRPADKTPPAPPGQFPAQVSEFVSDEVAAALTLTGPAAGVVSDVALDLAVRLPGTFQAQHAGIIDYPRARLIAESARILSDEQARQVEAKILPAAGEQTTGRLRAVLARAVIAVDPHAATRRREEAQKDPRVRRWREDAGTAALAGYSLPPADVLAADQRLTDRAKALRDAGLPGPLEELRARAYLDTLLGRDSAPPASPAAGPPVSPNGPTPLAPPRDSGASAPPRDPASSGPPNPPPGQPRLAARVNLIMPLATALGLADSPGLVAGFGPVDAPLARHLAGLSAANRASRFCITLTNTEGHAVGHGCLTGPGALAALGTRHLSLAITPLARGSCDHRHEEPRYQPSRKLQHLVWARTPTCTAPGCRRAAARCDLDHTAPYDHGGRTCECNLAPLCRHHHRCKQSGGWYLKQPQPGVLEWTTPAGRRYLTVPEPYFQELRAGPAASARYRRTARRLRSTVTSA